MPHGTMRSFTTRDRRAAGDGSHFRLAALGPGVHVRLPGKPAQRRCFIGGGARNKKAEKPRPTTPFPWRRWHSTRMARDPEACALALIRPASTNWPTIPEVDQHRCVAMEIHSTQPAACARKGPDRTDRASSEDPTSLLDHECVETPPKLAGKPRRTRCRSAPCELGFAPARPRIERMHEPASTPETWRISRGDRLA